jgi:hypothetical protein
MHISVEKDFDSVTHLLTQAGADVSILYDPELYKKRRNDAIKAITSAAIEYAVGISAYTGSTHLPKCLQRREACEAQGQA